MNPWENAVITTKGLTLLSKTMAGRNLEITRGKSGAGYITPGLLVNQTDVMTPMQDLIFRGVSYTEDGRCKLSCCLTNEGLSLGYKAKQIGVYAIDPDEGEILFFILQAASGEGTTVPSEDEMPGYSATWDLYVTYGQADGVSVMVDPSWADEVDSELSETSENAVQNRVVTAALNRKVDRDEFEAANSSTATALNGKVNRSEFESRSEELEDSIGEKASVSDFTATLAATAWTEGSGYHSQSVTVSGILATDTPLVDVILTLDAASNKEILSGWNNIQKITTASNTIIAYCFGDSPTVDIPIRLKVVR